MMSMTAYDILLRRLDADPQRAAEQYKILRLKLVLYFVHHRSPFPEDLADEVLHRVARRLEEAEDSGIANLSDYCFGVARHVRYEQGRGAQRQREEMPPESKLVAPFDVERALLERDEEQRRLERLMICLRRLPDHERELIKSYYHDEDRIQIIQREKLASRLKLTPGSLRSTAHRIRQKLERCVRKGVDS